MFLAPPSEAHSSRTYGGSDFDSPTLLLDCDPIYVSLHVTEIQGGGRESRPRSMAVGSLYSVYLLRLVSNHSSENGFRWFKLPSPLLKPPIV